MAALRAPAPAPCSTHRPSSSSLRRSAERPPPALSAPATAAPERARPAPAQEAAPPPPVLHKYAPALSNIVNTWSRDRVARRPLEQQPGPPAARPPLPPALRHVYTSAEFQKVVRSRPHSLMVVHVSTAGCPIDEAYTQLLESEARRWAGALFVCVNQPPGGAAAAAAAAGAPMPSADPSAALFQRLGAAQQPYTLLLSKRMLLARLELPSSGSGSSSSSGSGGGSSSGSSSSSGSGGSSSSGEPIRDDARPVDALLAARAAAQRLHSAVAAAMLHSRPERVERPAHLTTA